MCIDKILCLQGLKSRPIAYIFMLQAHIFLPCLKRHTFIYCTNILSNYNHMISCKFDCFFFVYILYIFILIIGLYDNSVLITRNLMHVYILPQRHF